jgi:hypothetical protein
MDVHPAAGAAGSGQGGVGGDQLGGHVWAIAQELDVRAAVGVRGASPGGRVLSEMSGP